MKCVLLKIRGSLLRDATFYTPAAEHPTIRGQNKGLNERT